MVRPPRNLDVLAAVTSVVIASVSTPAHADSQRVVRVEPAYFFRSPIAPPPPLVDTPEEAYQLARSHIETTCPQGYGYSIRCEVGAMFPDNSVGSINGRPNRYLFPFRYVYTYTSPPSTSVSGWNHHSVNTFTSCPDAYSRGGWASGPDSYVYCFKSLPALEPARCPAAGNPILLSTGAKISSEVDFLDPRGTLSFVRTYRSDYRKFSSLVDRRLIDYSGNGPMATFLREVVERNPGEYVLRSFATFGVGDRLVAQGLPREMQLIASADLAQVVGFTDVQGNFAADLKQNYRLRRLAEGGALAGWVVTYPDNAVEFYDAAGLLRSRTTVDGKRIELAYSTISPAVVLTAVDHFGRQLSFGHDSFGRLTTLTEPSGQQTSYTYQSAATCGSRACNSMASVTVAGTWTKRYLYGELEFVGAGGDSRLLTGIVDETGQARSIYRYDTLGRATSTEAALGVNRFNVFYGGLGANVTDPLGTLHAYGFWNVGGFSRLTSQSQPAGSGCGPSSSAITYDMQANVSSRTDFSNNKICYAYDLSRNLETKRVEGLSGSAVCSTALTSPPAVARVISTQWHPDWRLETRIAEPKKLTTITYNGQGATCAPSTGLVDGKPPAVICTRTEQATTDETGESGFAATVTGTARTWRYTYTTYGRVLTATDPNNRTTTTSYHADNDADLGKRGNVASITNAANHITSITDYSPHGQPIRIVDANGLVTVLTYDPRMRLRTRTVGTEASTFDYDPTGQLENVTLPDGATLTYSYDAAHRLTSISDHKGNRVAYTLDPMGNRTAEQLRDPGGVLVQNIARVIDALNRVERITGVIQ